MSEKEINSYRFLSGKEPSEEMLAVIMKEATEEAIAKKEMADAHYDHEMRCRYESLRNKYATKISSLVNG